MTKRLLKTTRLPYFLSQSRRQLRKLRYSQYAFRHIKITGAFSATALSKTSINALIVSFPLLSLSYKLYMLLSVISIAPFLLYPLLPFCLVPLPTQYANVHIFMHICKLLNNIPVTQFCQ